MLPSGTHQLLKTDSFKVVVVGEVDHGKSTFLGRILLDTDKVPQEKIDYVQGICTGKNLEFEPAFLFDALEEEQAQGISIDTTRINFQFKNQHFVFIDAPGHLEFLKNMTSGASGAQLGILLIDCKQGIRTQTERHLRILSLLGITKIIVAVNKIDQTNYNQGDFQDLCNSINTLIGSIGLSCQDIIPISALNGDNILSKSPRLDWYFGQPLLARLLEIAASQPQSSLSAARLRFLLQDVYRFSDKRYFAGHITSGTIKEGQELFFSPSGKLSKVEAIEKFPEGVIPQASAGESIALRLSEQIFIERGEVISFIDDAPEINTEFATKIVWLSSQPFDPQEEYSIKLGTAQTKCTIVPVPTDLIAVKNNKAIEATNLLNGSFIDAVIKCSKPLAYDYNGDINRFVLCSTYETVAAGTIVQPTKTGITNHPNIRIEQSHIQQSMHEDLHGHKGTVLWLTGLSGSGKSTLARELEKDLFEKGCKVKVLDGDNLRSGLCADLGFSPEDRAENIRRFAHVAKLFLESGFIVITACISPYKLDRELSREIIGADNFHEIFVFCPLEECQRRDPKGIYNKASTGQVKSLTGISSPYQSPQQPALRLDSSIMSVDNEIKSVIDLLNSKNILSRPEVCAQKQTV